MKQPRLLVFLFTLICGAAFSLAANASTLLVGTDIAGTSTTDPDYIFSNQWTAAASGDCNEIQIYSKANGHVKFGLYDNSKNALMLENTAQDITADQWNTYTVTSTAVTASTQYYLAVVYDVSGAVAYTDGDQQGYYLSGCTFGTCTLPDSGLTTNSGATITWDINCSEYGAEPTPTPTATPEVSTGTETLITDPGDYPFIIFGAIFIFVGAVVVARKL